MGKLDGTRTLENLMKAFAGESQARMRYTYFASIAKKEGYEQIAAIFQETADNEKEHAELFYKHIVKNVDELPVTIHVDADYPVELRSTLENLKASATGENEEWTKLYPKFADIAEEEGFKDIANTFRQVAKVEERHEARYLKLAKNVEEGKVFKKTKKFSGNVETAVMFLKLKKHRKSAPPANMREATLNFLSKTIEN